MPESNPSQKQQLHTHVQLLGHNNFMLKKFGANSDFIRPNFLCFGFTFIISEIDISAFAFINSKVTDHKNTLNKIKSIDLSNYLNKKCLKPIK